MKRILPFVAVAAAAILAAAAVFSWAGGGERPPGGSPGAPPTGAPSAAPSGSPAASPDGAPPRVTLVPIPGRFDHPVYVTAPPGDPSRLFVVEQAGRVVVVRDGVALARPFLDLSGLVSAGGEQGLLSLAFHPRYAQNGQLYVDYTDRAGDTRIVEYRASSDDPDRADPRPRRALLRVDQPYANHNGGQLQFGPDGRLWVGMGDGGSAGDPQGRAQDPGSLLGKLLRLDVDAEPAALEIYARGLRNPWRFSFDRSTGALWIGDVGQDAWEEIDYLPPGHPAGADFGWDGYEGGHVHDRATAESLHRDGLVWPVAEYGRDAGLSVTGGYVYRGAAVPKLRGFYVFADFGSGRVWAMNGPEGTPAALPGADGEAGAVASFGEDSAGELYLIDYGGTVYRVAPAP